MPGKVNPVIPEVVNQVAFNIIGNDMTITMAAEDVYKRQDTTIGTACLKFLAVFAPTQIPLAVIEGILTVLIISVLESYAKPELRAIGFLKEDK